MSYLTRSVRDTLLRYRSHAQGGAGHDWVERLPALIEAALERWSLTIEGIYGNVSYNYLAAVRTAGSEPAVLKVSFIEPELFTSIDALRHFDGRGAVRLLDSATDIGAILLERLEPGRAVSSLKDDAEEVQVTAGAMRSLWRPPPAEHSFPAFADWIENMARLRDSLPRSYAWLGHGIDLGRELADSSTGTQLLLHGDLHHDNVVVSQRGWLAIDGKGVTGEQAWEIGPYLYNNLANDAGEAAWRKIALRRAAQFSDELGLDRQRLYACAAVYAILSCSWSLDEHEGPGPFFAKRLAVANALAGL